MPRGSYKKEENKYILYNDYYKVYIRDEIFFLIDREDYISVSKYYWYCNRNGYIACCCIKGKKETLLHNYLLNKSETDTRVIDHINGDKTDNRKCNLRFVSFQENCFNKKLISSNVSGITGVIWDTYRNKWKATIGYNYKTINLGRFDNKKDAIAARKAAEEKYFGEFSYDASQEIAAKNKIKD